MKACSDRVFCQGDAKRYCAWRAHDLHIVSVYGVIVGTTVFFLDFQILCRAAGKPIAACLEGGDDHGRERRSQGFETEIDVPFEKSFRAGAAKLAIQECGIVDRPAAQCALVENCPLAVNLCQVAFFRYPDAQDFPVDGAACQEWFLPPDFFDCFSEVRNCVALDGQVSRVDQIN